MLLVAATIVHHIHLWRLYCRVNTSRVETDEFENVSLQSHSSVTGLRDRVTDLNVNNVFTSQVLFWVTLTCCLKPGTLKLLLSFGHDNQTAVVNRPHHSSDRHTESSLVA